MTHNDFDFHDDIIIPVVSFLEGHGLNCFPSQQSKAPLTIKDELFYPPTD